jgi:hypothetical protein
MIVILGQSWVLQICVSNDSPEQSAPALDGAGLSQSLNLSQVPPPHELVQFEKIDQEPQLPFTKI